MICNQGDIVIVPFPFVDSAETKKRPAVVLSKKQFNVDNQHTILAMITSGKGKKWKNDIRITLTNKHGKALDSVIRMKVFTLDNRIIRRKVGTLSLEKKKTLKTQLQNTIGI